MQQEWKDARANVAVQAQLEAMKAEQLGEDPLVAAALLRLQGELEALSYCRDALLVSQQRRAVGHYDDVANREHQLAMQRREVDRAVELVVELTTPAERVSA